MIMASATAADRATTADPAVKDESAPPDSGGDPGTEAVGAVGDPGTTPLPVGAGDIPGDPTGDGEGSKL